MQNGQFGSKIKNAKNHSTRSLELFCAKNRARKYQILEKWDNFENRPSQAKGIAHAKWSVPVKNLGCQKHAKNHSTESLELFCAKNRARKCQIFEK